MPKKVLIDFDLNNGSRVTNSLPAQNATDTVILSQMNTAVSGIVSGYIGISSIDALADVDTSTEAPVEDQSLIWDGGNWVPGSPEVLIEVKNPSVSLTIAKGTPVYVSGNHGPTGKPEITPARSDSDSTMPAIGLTQGELAPEAEGFVIAQGILTNIDTDTPAWDPGTALFVDPTTAGDLTSTRPTSESHSVQKVALVTRRSATVGAVIVMGAGRANDQNNQYPALLGVANTTTTDLGTFTGGTIADSVSVKTALQSLETAVELKADKGAATNGEFTMSTDRLLGRDTAGDGAIEEIQLQTPLNLSSGRLNISTGGITSTQLGTGSVETDELADGAVTGAKLSTGTVEVIDLEEGDPVRTVSSTTLTDVYTHTITDGMQGNRYRLCIYGDVLQNSGSDQNLQLQVQLAGTTLHDSAASVVNDADRYPFQLELTLSYRAANKQYLLGNYRLGQATVVTTGQSNMAGITRDGVFMQNAGTATDSASMAFTCRMKFATSATNSEVRIYSATLEQIKGP